jgi:CRP-like cAMP-binding protein
MVQYMTENSLEQLSLFEDFDPEQRALLGELFSPSFEPLGTLLFEQGAPAEHLYLVVDGEVHIQYKPDDGPLLTVARVQANGVVGWSAALGSPFYTSSAECSEDCNLLRVRGEDLRTLYKEHPDTGRKILGRLAAVIAERLRNTHHHVVELLEQGLRVDVKKTIPVS